jgi:hypothetical protein
MASNLNPLTALLGFVLAYKGAVLAIAVAVWIAWPLGATLARQGASWIFISTFFLLLAVISLLPGFVPAEFQQTIWLPALVALGRFLTGRLLEWVGEEDTKAPIVLFRMVVMFAAMTFGAILINGLAERYAPLREDDLPWQPVERVTVNATDGKRTITGALLGSDGSVLTYLEITPRRVVVIREADVLERALCRRDGDVCRGMQP